VKNMPLIVRRLFASLSGLMLTWLVIHIPGDYAYASVWLMPSVAAFFACATGFAIMCRGMDRRTTSVGKPSGAGQQRSEYRCMARGLGSFGWVCVGVGILSALIQAISSPSHCSWELPFAMGVGILVGVKAFGKKSAQRVETRSKPLSRSAFS